MGRGLILLLCLTVAAYSGLWGAGFVWDDIPLIVENTALAEASLVSLFTSDLWAHTGAGDVASGYYRPLVLLSFALDRAAFGLDPAGYHLHSLLWHLFAVAGLAYLLTDLLGRGPALLGAALFALHPAQSEVVVWIAARNDLMAAAFGFAAMSVMWKKLQPSWGRSFIAILLVTFAALSKETAFVLPVMFGAAELVRGRRDGLWVRLMPFIVGVGLVVALRTVLGLGAAVVPSANGWLLLAQSALDLIGLSGAAVVTPWPLSSARDLSWIERAPAWRVQVGLLFVAVSVLSLRLREQRGMVALGLIWAGLLMAVTWIPIADKGGFGDRFLYWPMAGFSILLAATAGQYWRVFVPLIALPAVFIIQARLPDWQDDEALWRAAVRDVPTPTNAVSLGHTMMVSGRYLRAHVSFVGSIAGPTIDVDGCAGVVGSAMRAGLAGHALKMGLWAEARGCPPQGGVHGWMATAAAIEEDWDLAADWANRLPADPRLRDVVVQAALARRSGDQAAYEDILGAWVDSAPLEAQVDALIGRREDTADAVKKSP